MESDISRQTFDPKKHYTQVIMQQGRVQIDADWNEQQAITQYRTECIARDLIGPRGAPEDGGGFELLLLPGDRDLLITPGRIYVDGILCELEPGLPLPVLSCDAESVRVERWNREGHRWQPGQWLELLNEDRGSLDLNTKSGLCYQIASIRDEGDQQWLSFHIEGDERLLSEDMQQRVRFLRRITTYCTQLDYPDPAYSKKSGPLHELDLADHALLIAYLDVWQRPITVFEDAQLREVALEGPDTTTRLKTVWQVKFQPFLLSPQLQALLKEEHTILHEKPALEKAARGREKDEREREQELKRLESEIVFQLNSYGCDTYSLDWQELVSPSSGMLNVTTYHPASEGDGDLRGYQGIENQLYRVEIHESTYRERTGERALTVKWAYNNASTVVHGLVEAPFPGTRGAKSSNTVTILNNQQINSQALLNYHFVEIVDERSDLHPEKVRNLLKISRVEQDQLILATELEPGTVVLRLWNDLRQVTTGSSWEPLDQGVSIQFSSGGYKPGDYWLIPARTATREVIWPPYEQPNRHPVPQTRYGVQHHYCRLARVRWYRTRTYTPARNVRDCRHIFQSLPEVVQTLNVVKINWDHDSLHPRSIMREGLIIMLNLEPEPVLAQVIEDNILIVTLEIQNPGGGTEGIFIVDGSCELRGRSLVWHWDWHEKDGELAKLFREIDKIGGKLFTTPKHFIRVRVRLLGHMIWRMVNGRPIYLDGQTLGMPGRDLGAGRQPEGRPRVDLRLPSGNGAKASDFESWFYIRE